MMDVKILYALLTAAVTGLFFFLAAGFITVSLAVLLGADSDGATALGVLAGIISGVLGFAWYYDILRKRQEQHEAGQADYIEEPKASTTRKLRDLKRLFDDGVITESEFEAKKAELLRDL